MRLTLLLTLLALPVECLWTQVRPVDPDPAATARVVASGGPFALWIDPALWTCTDDRPGRQVLRDRGGNLEAEWITAATPSTSVALKNRLLERFRKIDPQAVVNDSEARTVRGHEILFVRFDYNQEGRRWLVYAALYGGPSGYSQLTYSSILHVPIANVRSFNRLLAGIEVREAEPIQ